MLNRNMLSIFVGLFFLLSCFQFQRGASDQKLMTAANINYRIKANIVPPYRTAYRTLNYRIVQPLLKVNTKSNQGAIRILIQSLLFAAKMVRDQLHKATKASEELRTSIDERIAQLVLSISNQEKQVHESQAAVNEANLNVQHIQHQVTIAEAAVRDSQHSLNIANQDVHEAQKAVDKARVCGVGRRRKRFLGGGLRDLNPVKIFRNTVGKPLCSVINSGGINSAKERRAMAEQRLHQTQQRLHSYQKNLATQRAQYDTAQAQLNAANTQLQTITLTLNEQRAKQSLVVSLIKQCKDVEVHLNNVLGSSTVLLDGVAQLIDFELVIEPLNSIYEEMLQNNIMESFGFKITAETAKQIEANLQKLAEKMPKMPLNEMSETGSEEVRSPKIADKWLDTWFTDKKDSDSSEIDNT